MNKNKIKTGAKPKAEKKVLTKNKKLLIIGAVLGVVVLLGGITAAIILICNNSQQEQPKEMVTLNDNLEFEINGEVKIAALVSEKNMVNVLNESEAINTSSLGEQEVIIRYEVDGSEETAMVTITIVDTKPPIIEYQKELTTTAGIEIDLLKDVKVTDNSKEEIKAIVEGDYDFKTEGTHNLKYVATDKSGNKTEESFTLIVNKKPVVTSSGSTNTITKPNTTQGNTTNSGSSSVAMTPAQQEMCNKASAEWTNSYRGKVFTAIPSSANAGVQWSSARLYVTAEKDGNAILYTLQNERIYGKNLDDSYATEAKKLLGPLQEMRYTKENPLIIYFTTSFSCAGLF